MFSKLNIKLKMTAFMVIMAIIMIASVSFAAIDLATCNVDLYTNSGLTSAVTDSSYSFDNTQKKPYVKVTSGGTTVSSSDYTVNYYNNINACDGTATVEVVAKGSNTTGKGYAYFSIKPATLDSSNFKFSITGTKIYDGKISHPKISEASIKGSDGSFHDLGWKSFKFDGNDVEPDDFLAPIPRIDLLVVGSYYITFESTNFTNSRIDWVYVFPKPMTCTWTPNSFVYDGAKHIPTPTFSTGVTGEKVIDYELEGHKINVGSNYPAYASVTELEITNSSYNGIDYMTNDMHLLNYIILPSSVSTSQYTSFVNNYKPTVDTDFSNPANTTFDPSIADYIIDKVGEWTLTSETRFEIVSNSPDIKIIKDSDVSNPVDKVYKGSAWTQDPTVTVNGTKLTKGTHYTVSYSPNTDVGTVTITVTGIPENGYTGTVTKTFEITPVPITVNWSDRDTFQFDGKYHIRKGTVSGPIQGETIEFTLKGKQKNVGNGYNAVITITGVKGGRGKLSNYTLPNPTELTRQFKIVSLPFDEQRPTDKPENDPEKTPDQEPVEGYTVEIVVKWPDKDYTYDGNEQKPVPEKVELVIKDGNGNVVGTPEELSPDDYELIYDNNVNARDKDDPNPPTVTIKAVPGGNVTGEVEHPFTIKPAPLTVKADNKTKKQGETNPELTYTVTGAKNGEKPKFDGELETTCKKDSPNGSYPIYCDGKLEPVTNGSFNPANYTITYKDGTLKVGESSNPIVPNEKIVDLGVDLRSGSPNKKKVNKNHYKIVEEEVIYWVDYINGGDTTDKEINLVLNLPLSFKTLDADGGTVDTSKRTITWKFSNGLKHNEGGTKEVHLKYTKFSKSGITEEEIYPMATIALVNSIKDRSSVHNIVYTEDEAVKINHKVYMWGDQDSPTFRPTEYISRAEGAMVLLRIFDIDYQKVQPKGNEFPDLDQTYEQAQKAIVKAADLGLIDGYEDGTYRPNRKMTRGEFMKLIAVYVEYKAKEDGILGIDLDDTSAVTRYAASNTWANKYVSLLVRLNLTPISEESPDLEIEEYITRAEVAQLCNLYLFRCPVYDDGRIELPFVDVDKSTEHWGDIVEATRPSHESYDLDKDVHEVWEYNDWKKAYEEGFTNKYLY